MEMKFLKPVYAQCKSCDKQYDMAKWGVDCPSCKKTKKKIK